MRGARHLANPECCTLRASTICRIAKLMLNLFVQNVLANKAELESGVDITKQLLSTLKSWLMYHIKYDDANYVADVKRHLAEKSQRESGWFSRLAHRFFK